MSDDFGKFTAPRPDEEMHQGSEVPVTFSIDPSDRMPLPATPDNEDRPPPLAVDTLVCMEDKRSFVIRNSDGSVYISFEPQEVSRLPNGEYFVEIPVLMRAVNAAYPGREDYDQPKENFTSLGMSERLGIYVGDRTVARVEPIRPACAHYARLQSDISADRSRRFLSRSCMAQRSETGEYYSVGDAAIYACSLRSPRHLESEQILDDFDALKVQQANEKIQAGLFDVDKALAEEDASPERTLGILGSNPKG